MAKTSPTIPSLLAADRPSCQTPRVSDRPACGSEIIGRAHAAGSSGCPRRRHRPSSWLRPLWWRSPPWRTPIPSPGRRCPQVRAAPLSRSRSSTTRSTPPGAATPCIRRSTALLPTAQAPGAGARPDDGCPAHLSAVPGRRDRDPPSGQGCRRLLLSVPRGDGDHRVGGSGCRWLHRPREGGCRRFAGGRAGPRPAARGLRRVRRGAGTRRGGSQGSHRPGAHARRDLDRHRHPVPGLAARHLRPASRLQRAPPRRLLPAPGGPGSRGPVDLVGLRPRPLLVVLPGPGRAARRPGAPGAAGRQLAPRQRLRLRDRAGARWHPGPRHGPLRRPDTARLRSVDSRVRGRVGLRLRIPHGRLRHSRGSSMAADLGWVGSTPRRRATPPHRRSTSSSHRARRSATRARVCRSPTRGRAPTTTVRRFASTRSSRTPTTRAGAGSTTYRRRSAPPASCPPTSRRPSACGCGRRTVPGTSRRGRSAAPAWTPPGRR